MTDKEKRQSYWDAKSDPYHRMGGYDEYMRQRQIAEAKEKADEIAAWNRFCDLMSGTGTGRSVKVSK